MGDYSDNFAAAVMNDLGIPQTTENFKFFQAWAKAEGGNAKYNPFNTTQAATGATDYNNVHVRNYPDFDTGVAATVKTLSNGRYNDILASLKKGTSAVATAQSSSLATWGTGSGVLRVLNGGGSLNPPTTSDSSSALTANTSTTLCYWNFKSPSLGPVGGSTYCLDPILWLSLGLVGTGAFLVGAALIAIGSGHGAKTGHKVVNTLGPSGIVRAARKTTPKSKASAKPTKAPAKEGPNLFDDAGAEMRESAKTTKQSTTKAVA